MTTYEAFLKNVDKYHIYEIIASQKICTLNNTKLSKFNDDYRYDFKTLDKFLKDLNLRLKRMNYHYQQIIYSLNLKGIRKSLEYQYQKRIIIYFVIQLITI